MGFLSSLFGGGGSKPATTTNIVSQKLPDEIAPFVSEVLKEGKAQFEAEKAAGYRPYTGQTSADLTAEQERALTGLSGLVGTQQPFLDESGEIIRRGAEEFTGDTAQKFMSPYQQAVTDIEKREAQRNFEGNILPKLEAQAVGAGAMSGLGSRAGVEFAEAQRNQAQLLADIQAKGQQRAFDAARNEFGLQKAREAQMASNIANLGGRQISADLTELGALKSAGEERQQQAQGALDEAYFKFLEEQQFPKQNLAEYSQLIYGNPLTSIPTRSSTSTDTPFQPSTGQNLLGIGLGAANIFGLGGGFSSDGFSRDRASNVIFGRAEGGKVDEGLSSLPVVKAQVGTPGGMVVPPPLSLSGKPFSTDIDTRPEYEKISDELMDPTTSAPRRAQLIEELTSGRMSFTGPSQSAAKERNREREKELSDINIKADNARVKANEAGLTALKSAISTGVTERKENLDKTLSNKQKDLVKSMQKRGASTKEIQDALNAMPQRGPGLSTKTGSAQGIGQDIVNILDTLRTDVNKQRALDDTRKRADIMALGRMKRADQEKGITAQSDITTTEGAGRERNIDKKQEGAILVGKTEAANLISKLTNEQTSRLKEFTLKEKGIDKIENLPKAALAEFMELEKLRLKKEKAKTDRIAAGKKGKPDDKTPIPFLKDLKSNIAIGMGYVYDEETDTVMSGNVPLEGAEARKYQKIAIDAENEFAKYMENKPKTNANYLKAQRYTNDFITKEMNKVGGAKPQFKKGVKARNKQGDLIEFDGTKWVKV
jgi:hypothetical protein